MKSLKILLVEVKLIFSLYTFVVQTEDKYQQLIEIDKEELVVLPISQKRIRQLIKGLEWFNYNIKRDDRQTDVYRGRISRQRRKR